MSLAVFFDRDGVLNKPIMRRNILSSPLTFNEFRLFPELVQPLSHLKQLNYLVFVVTNQPEVARGTLSIGELQAMHDYILRELPVDEIATCPHDDYHGCVCRKPKPGMLINLAKKWGVDLAHSFLIGDSWKDIEAGRRAGCFTCLITRDYNRGVAGHFAAASVISAVTQIVHRNS